MVTSISQSNELRLNKGEKWEVSNGISTRIEKMGDIIKATDIQNFDPAELSYTLHVEIRMMTSICATKGEAHNQLHNYIDPLKEQVSGLRIANNVAKGPLLQSIQTYLHQYKTYFN